MINMNNKGLSKISLVFFAVVFVILWALFFGSQLTQWGNVAIINGGYSGIEAFFYGNLNLVVGCIFLISMLALGSVSE